MCLPVVALRIFLRSWNRDHCNRTRRQSRIPPSKITIVRHVHDHNIYSATAYQFEILNTIPVDNEILSKQTSDLFELLKYRSSLGAKAVNKVNQQYSKSVPLPFREVVLFDALTRSPLNGHLHCKVGYRYEYLNAFELFTLYGH